MNLETILGHVGAMILIAMSFSAPLRLCSKGNSLPERPKGRHRSDQPGIEIPSGADLRCRNTGGSRQERGQGPRPCCRRGVGGNRVYRDCREEGPYRADAQGPGHGGGRRSSMSVTRAEPRGRENRAATRCREAGRHCRQAVRITPEQSILVKTGDFWYISCSNPRQIEPARSHARTTLMLLIIPLP